MTLPRQSARSGASPRFSLLLALLFVFAQMVTPGALDGAGRVPIAVAAAAPGSSLALNGTTAYADTPQAADLNLTYDWTIESWFKDETPGGYNHAPRVLLTKGDPLIDRQVPYGIVVAWNMLIAGERSGDGGRLITYNLASHNVSANAWHHLAASFRGSTRTLTLYLDGVVVAQKTSPAVAASGNTRPVTIGRDGGGSFFWRGKVDDIRVWNVVRSPAELAANYRAELSGPGEGLVANWRMNDAMGLTATDLTGAHPATLRGGATWSGDVPGGSGSGPTPTPTSTASPTAEATGSPTATATPTGAATGTATATASATATPTVAATGTATSTATTIATATATATPIATATATPTATATATATPIATATASPTTGALPPDPASVAPPLDRSVATDLATGSQFLYTGNNPIQTGVAAGTIDPHRVAVLRGRVQTVSGAPLPGATISILNHREMGHTLSRSDGMFDMAVNGGGLLTVDYRLAGYLPAQRGVQVPWRDYTWLPDVSLVAVDSRVTSIDLTSTAPLQVARGSQVTDSDGTRQATLLFKPGTTAIMTLAGGGTQALGSLRVRATEYTAGPNGPQSMPASLPPTSSYTYAVELGIDEAIAAGADRVSFNQPVPFYVDNFLNFRPGVTVPVGYYDSALGQWVPSDNGRVLQILGVSNGLAMLDVDGSGQPASAQALASLGVSDDERQQLASLYTPGKSLWRAPLSHFSSYDLNLNAGPPDDATAPDQDAPVGDDPPDKPSVRCGSIIGCENQTLGEDVELTGTSLQLHYSGDRVPGRTAANSLRIFLSGANVPQSLIRIDMEVLVAGRKFTESFGPGPNQSTVFTWDGKDAYGRVVQGPQAATIGVGYAYGNVYRSSSQVGQAFMMFGDFWLLNPARNQSVIWQWWQRSIGPWDGRAYGLGGWSLDVHHAYDPAGSVLFLGDGTRRDAQGLYPVLTTLAGTAQSGGNGDGGPASQATFNQPAGVAVGPDGSVYIADSNNSRVRRIDPSGNISTVAGNGAFCAAATTACGDGGQATAASMCTPWGLAVSPDNSLYIVDSGCNKVRVVSSNGTISTLAGTGALAFGGDGGPAAQAAFNTPQGIAIGPDGAIYIADTNNQRIRRVDRATGGIATVAGIGTPGFGGDTGQANQAQLNFPRAIAFGSDGSLYVADWANSRVRRVAPSGIISTFAGSGARQGDPGNGGPASAAVIRDPAGLAVDPADGSLYIATSDFKIWRVLSDGTAVITVGTGQCCFNGDGLPAAQALLSAPRGVAVAPDRALLVSDNSRIRRASSSLPGFSGTDLSIASEDGRELYQFDPHGRHLRTLDTLTGGLRYQFIYDPAGTLISIDDAYGNRTSIEHDGRGSPTAIVAPGGQRTSLSVDGNGFLASLADPAGDTVRLTSTADGLLKSLTDADANVHTFVHDSQGRLTSDADPVGSVKTLTRTESADGSYKVVLNSTLNRVTTYQVDRLRNGGVRRTVIEPSGAQTIASITADGTRLIVYPDGSGETVVYGPDPRWGMQAPVVTSISLGTPGGLVENVIATRTAVLQDPNNLLSLQSQTDTLALNGNTFTRVFDAASRTFTLTSAEGRQQTTTIDANGRVIAQLRAPGQDPRTFSYDLQGRLIAVHQGLLSTTFAYDALNRLTATTDVANTTRQIAYDAADRPLQVTEFPNGKTMGMVYDANGNRTHLILPGGGDQTFGYTAANQPASYTPPGNSSFTNTYDLDGGAVGAAMPSARIINTSYDASGRVTGSSYPEASVALSYTDRTRRLGHMTRSPAAGGTSQDLAFTFDGSLLTGVVWSGAAQGSYAYTYDTSLRPTLLKLTSGADTVQTALSYDKDSLLTGYGPFTIGRGGPAGAPSSIADGTLNASFAYDAEARGVARTIAVRGQPSYGVQTTYDAADRISQRVETAAGVSHTFTYTYDADNQLTQVARDGQIVEAYTYDANGNRTSRQVAGGSAETATYDAQDRLVQRGSTGYTFDADGYLSTRGADTFQYSARGELLRATVGGATVSYTYDGAARRVSRTDAAGTTQYLYGDPTRPLLVTAVRGASGVLATLYYDEADRLFALERGGVRSYVATDQVGTPRVIVDSSGAAIRIEEWDSFGRLQSDTNPAFDMPVGFGGGLADPVTGLVRLGFRDYDPESGRWTARDPLLFGAGQANLYAYVNNDPINARDPSGTDEEAAEQPAHRSLGERIKDAIINWIDGKGKSFNLGPVSVNTTKPEFSVGTSADFNVGGKAIVSTSAEAAVGITTTGTACDPLFSFRFKLGAKVPALAKIPVIGNFFKNDFINYNTTLGEVKNYQGTSTQIEAASSQALRDSERN